MFCVLDNHFIITVLSGTEVKQSTLQFLQNLSVLLNAAAEAGGLVNQEVSQLQIIFLFINLFIWYSFFFRKLLKIHLIRKKFLSIKILHFSKCYFYPPLLAILCFLFYSQHRTKQKYILNIFSLLCILTSYISIQM